jgi:hypothetical protein
MYKQIAIINYTVSFLSLIFFIIVINGCGNKADLATQISGEWRAVKGTSTVNIKLNQDPKSVIFDGHAYKATVEQIDRGAYSVKVKVESEAGETEEWLFRQLWDDNGSMFHLAFVHNGATETLIPGGPS